MSGGGGLTERRVRAVRWRMRLVAGVAVTAALAGCSTSPQSGELPLRQVSETALTGGPVRFDYTALDAERGRLFIAHMGASELIDVDVRAHAVVRTLPDLPRRTWGDRRSRQASGIRHRDRQQPGGRHRRRLRGSRVPRPDRHVSRRTGLRPHPAHGMDDQRELLAPKQ